MKIYLLFVGLWLIFNIIPMWVEYLLWRVESDEEIIELTKNLSDKS